MLQEKNIYSGLLSNSEANRQNISAEYIFFSI